MVVVRILCSEKNIPKKGYCSNSKNSHPLKRDLATMTSIVFGAFCLDVRALNCLPTNGFSIKPLKVKLLAEEQATEL